jgi:hypothetical protein
VILFHANLASHAERIANLKKAEQERREAELLALKAAAGGRETRADRQKKVSDVKGPAPATQESTGTGMKISCKCMAR